MSGSRLSHQIGSDLVGARVLTEPLFSFRHEDTMQRASLLAIGLIPAILQAQSPASLSKPVRIIDSIPAPESVALGPDHAWYVSSFGKFGVKGDGAVYRVQPDSGTREVYAGGLDDPCGLALSGEYTLGGRQTRCVSGESWQSRAGLPGRVRSSSHRASWPRPTLSSIASAVG